MKSAMSKTLLSAGVALCFSVAPAAQATILSSFLTFDGPQCTAGPVVSQCGGEDRLQDDSLSAYIPAGGSTQSGFAVGDIIYGMITMSNVGASGRSTVNVGADNQVMILFSAQVTGFAGAGATTGSPVLQLGAVPTSSSFDLAEICGAICAGHVTANTIGVALTTPQTENALSNGANPLNWTTAQVTTFLNEGGATHGPWGWEASLGLDATSDFFNFKPNSTTNVQLGGIERGAFTIENQDFGVKQWAPVDLFNFNGDKVLGDATLDIGSVATNITDAQRAGGWFFKDQSSFYVNPIPEPGSLALMGIALAGLGGMARRRLQG